MRLKYAAAPLVLFLLAACVSHSDPAVSDYRRGLAAYSAGLTDRAVSFYTAAIERGTLSNADQAAAYERRCAAHLAKGFFAFAVNDCTAALELDDGLASAYNGRCWAYARSNRLTLAVADCEKAVSLDRDEKSFAHNLGFVYEGLGDLDKAKSAYGQALALDPAYVEAREGLDRVTTSPNPI